mmetsp:Transcript_32533/g.52715  ORF Transcript_32533/g.52715 Transcript_32533/m.52715 type:complete len:321 (+) Transcript_32533:44-1006(+)
MWCSHGNGAYQYTEGCWTTGGCLKCAELAENHVHHYASPVYGSALQFRGRVSSYDKIRRQREEEERIEQEERQKFERERPAKQWYMRRAGDRVSFDERDRVYAHVDTEEAEAVPVRDQLQRYVSPESDKHPGREQFSTRRPEISEGRGYGYSEAVRRGLEEQDGHLYLKQDGEAQKERYPRESRLGDGHHEDMYASDRAPKGEYFTFDDHIRGRESGYAKEETNAAGRYYEVQEPRFESTRGTRAQGVTFSGAYSSSLFALSQAADRQDAELARLAAQIRIAPHPCNQKWARLPPSRVEWHPLHCTMCTKVPIPFQHGYN